jgi:hypothetical protein
MIGPSINQLRERERIQLLGTWKKVSSIVVITCKQVENFDIQKNVPMIEIRFLWIKLQK